MNLSSLVRIGVLCAALICLPLQASIELTLVCDVKTRFEYNGRLDKTLDISTRIEVMDFPSQGHLSIIPDSDDLPSVSTRAGGDREVVNHSNQEKWHLRNKITRENVVSEHEFVIDRYAGTLSFNGTSQTRGNTLSRVGFGSCRKVAKSQKKF